MLRRLPVPSVRIRLGVVFSLLLILLVGTLVVFIQSSQGAVSAAEDINDTAELRVLATRIQLLAHNISASNQADENTLDRITIHLDDTLRPSRFTAMLFQSNYELGRLIFVPLMNYLMDRVADDLIDMPAFGYLPREGDSFPLRYLICGRRMDVASCFDQSTISRQEAAMDQARATGQPAATGPIILPATPTAITALFVYTPVYDDTVLVGYALQVIDVAELMQMAMSDNTTPVAAVVDVTGAPMPVYVDAQDYPVQREMRLPVYGRTWQISLATATNIDAALLDLGKTVDQMDALVVRLGEVLSVPAIVAAYHPMATASTALAANVERFIDVPSADLMPAIESSSTNMAHYAALLLDELQIGLASQAQTNQRLTIVIALIALSVIVFALLTVYQIIQDLSHVNQTALHLAGGEFSTRATIYNYDEIGQIGVSMNALANDIEGLVDTLEQRVADRTRDVRVAASLSNQMATVLDLDVLLPQLVTQTREGFDLYHVSIYLNNPDTGALTLSATTGQAVKAMKSEIVPGVDDSPVADAARWTEAVLRSGTDAASDLPETSTRLSLPMVLGRQLIGVLDLHAAQADRFNDDELRVLRALAEQFGVAVQNARLYAEQVQVAEELRTLDSLKSQFLASVSHELRTPLNAVINFTQFVATGLLGPVNERQVDALEKAVSSGKHLLSLINDVLDITKIEAGRMSLVIEDNIDLQAELDATYEIGHTLLEGKPVELVRDYDCDLPAIQADRRRLRQILYNLMSNACKFTDEGTITLRAEVRDEAVVVMVSDTGSGIEIDEGETIFAPFRQARAGHQSGNGTGLGLPISRKLALAHGGDLWYESQPGIGSTFYVSLPTSML